MYSIGIDWADETHDICVMRADGQVLSEFKIQHNWKGFKQLTTTLEELDGFTVNLERADGLLVEWMLSQQWPIYVTPGKIVASKRPRASKNDRGDAYLLANLRRLNDQECQPLVVHSDIVVELRQLTQAYDQLQAKHQAFTNQLRQVLKAYYPVAFRLFSKLHQPLTLAFLQRFPTPQAAQNASLDDLTTFFKQQHYRYTARIPTVYQLLQAPLPTLRTDTGCQAHMLALVAVLSVLDDQLKALKRQLTTVFRAHPEADWWLSFPGAGPLTAPRLLARIGDNRQQFPTYHALQATAGTVPVTRRSGKHTSVVFRWACSHPLRDAAINLARNSIRQSGWARSYYLDQLQRGHTYSRAYRALANRWLKIIWTLWQRRELYDESRHVANRARRGLHTIST